MIFGMLTALWLGVLTSISPCPLATNIAAVTFISKKLGSSIPTLLNGILYTLGRTLTYFLLSLVIISGLFSIPSLSILLQNYIAKLLGPILILAGMVLLDLLPFPSLVSVCGNIHTKLLNKGYAGSFLLGALFALAFCPTSAAIFFGAMIPLALDKHSILGMPVLYGIGTGIPVMVFAILIAFGFNSINKAFQNTIKLELWARRITGVLFIAIGIYYILTHIFGLIVNFDIFYLLQLFADWVTYNVFGIAKDTLLASAINFFIFDTVKIFLLLTVIIFAISMIRTFLPPERTRRILSHKRKYVGNILAALLGIVTPFCSCSAVPLFLGFLEAGVPLGVTFSFLVSSPMINEVALIMLLGMFGWRIALLYIVSGLIISILSGIIIGKLNVENLIEASIFKKDISNGNLKFPFKLRLQYAKDYTIGILRKVWPYVVGGIAVGAWIHGYVPSDFLAKYAGNDKWYAVPVATLLGIPLYSNAAGVIPLVSALTEKGVALGTTLAFMMAVTGLSLPEFIILKKVMKMKLVFIFAGIVGAGIILTGYLFNLIL